MEFEIGQIFEGEYPVEAAEWCNNNNCYIDELQSKEDGTRMFQIFAVPAPTEQELAERALAQAKSARQQAVEKIIVEVDGMKFDGDETSQTRIGRTLAAASALNADFETETRMWVLADNTIAHPTLMQLAQALRLAGDAQTAVWADPYQ